MSINTKKYTKDQMAKMVEEAQAGVTALEAEIADLKNCIDKKNDLLAEYAKLKAEMQRKNAVLTEQLDQMNGESINKANEIANLKADADILRMKLKDTETALGRSANEASRLVSELQDVKLRLLDDEYEADLAHECPWRNLWAWVKRKLKMA